MTNAAVSVGLRRLAVYLLLGACVLRPTLASAQFAYPYMGFGALPSFAWPRGEVDGAERWTGSYARMSTGFAVSSSKQFGSYAGPTVGFEGGRLWQEGQFVYGIVGGFDYLPVDGWSMPRFGGLGYSRDLAGAVQIQVGTLLTPDVLVYGKVGALAVHERWRLGTPSSIQSYSRDDIAVRPDARVGVEWAITPNLSVAVEAGITGRGIR